MALALGGCVHRIEIRQGDIRVAQNAEKLTAGMSQSEVRELLGEPQTQSPFRSEPWIYFYKNREPGFFGETGRFVLKINFEDKRVRDFEVLEEGSFPELEAAKKQAEEEEKAREEESDAEEDANADEDKDADADADENADADKGEEA